MPSCPRIVLVFSLLLSGCPKERDDIEPVSSAGTGAVTAGSGTGGEGGEATTTTSTATSGTGGSAAIASSSSAGGSGGDATGGGAPATTGAGGSSTACGEDVECWGDEATLCDASSCSELFLECSPGDPSPFRNACGIYLFQFRTGVWAHLVDCMRDASSIECSDGEAGVEACLDEARAQACGTAQIDAICDAAEVSCPGFDADACRSDTPLYVQEQVDYYESCVENGGDCATLHDVCTYGEPKP